MEYILSIHRYDIWNMNVIWIQYDIGVQLWYELLIPYQL